MFMVVNITMQSNWQRLNDAPSRREDIISDILETSFLETLCSIINVRLRSSANNIRAQKEFTLNEYLIDVSLDCQAE